MWSRAVVGLALSGILIAQPLTGSSDPAYAAGGTLNLSIEAVNPSIQSGQTASFRLQWTCTGAGSCDDAKIEVPVPMGVGSSTAYPGGIPLSVQSQSGVDLGAGEIPGSGTLVGSAPDQTLQWMFPASVATGASGTVVFTLSTPNSITPDGTTIAPVGTMTATNAVPVTVNSNGSVSTTVASQASLKVEKRKQSPSGAPYLNQQVTYSLLVGYEEQFLNATGLAGYSRNMYEVCSTFGVQALENLQVVDTLPPGVEFISASDSGSYDPVNGTVTWTLGSSISDTAPHSCVAYQAASTWIGSPLTVTVRYPSTDFEADPSQTAVTNSVVATANKWGQPDEDLSSDSAVSHALRDGSSGASVSKSPGYDWAVGAPFFREVRSSGQLYYLTAISSEPTPARWQVTDMLPCGLVSPMVATQTDCSTPAFTDITFSADQLLAEIELKYTTNTGDTGVCTIPAGTSMSDGTRRFCNGTSALTPIPLPSGQWITKFEIDTQVPAFGGGHIFIYGTPKSWIPTENVSTVYNNTYLNVDRSDQHPWFVTVENCTITNQITTQSGTVHLAAPQNQTAANNGGICGYVQVMTDPFRLSPAKSIYDSTLPGSPPAVPTVLTGQILTVDLTIHRRVEQNDSPEVTAQSRLTPTVTDILPANLEYIDDSLQIVAKAASSDAYVAALGTPNLQLTTVNLGGEDRQNLTVTFPDADIPVGATSMGKEVLVRFQVQLKDGTPAGTYQNSYLLSGEEGGAGVDTTYLLCSRGTMVDEDWQATSDQNLAVGCLASASYTVLPVPGAKAIKTVQGLYDAAALDAPGIGSTSIGGTAEYAIDIVNSGSVDISNVVAYDLLPRLGDTLTLPGASGVDRDSEFPVHLTGAVTVEPGVSVEYSTSLNPCRGDLAGVGGGSVSSSPTGCDNDWAASPPMGNYGSVTALRFDFGSRVFSAGEVEQIMLPVTAVSPNHSASARLDGIAWNNVAIVAVEASSGTPTLPTEQTPVGLQVIPDLTWSKVDGDTEALLGGSEWLLEAADDFEPPQGGVGASLPATIADCIEAPCAGPDQDPAVGKFRINGLPWGEYLLTELVAPSGYHTLGEPIEVLVDADAVDRDSYVLDLGPIDNALVQGEWSLLKTSIPISGSTVAPGSLVEYTLTATNDSEHPVTNVTVTDDLTDVLNNASFAGFTHDDDEHASRSGNTITWDLGTLAPNTTRSVTYSVTIDDGAFGATIRNLVSGSGGTDPIDCTVEDPCETTHLTAPVWTLAKSSDPKSGSAVQPGNTVTYTLSASNPSQSAVKDIVVVDDLSKVLRYATFGQITQSDNGNASRSDATLTWNIGELAAGETREVSYTISVARDAHGVVILNSMFGTGEVSPDACTAEEPCTTTHNTPALTPSGGLSNTGDSSLLAIGTTAALLMIGSGLLVLDGRRRSSAIR